MKTTGKIIHSGSGASSRGFRIPFKRKGSLLRPSGSPALVHRAAGKVLVLRLKVERAERLLVLRKILSQNIPQRLGLLRAQKNCLVIAYGHLLGALTRGETE